MQHKQKMNHSQGSDLAIPQVKSAVSTDENDSI